MNRLGFRPEAFPAALARLRALTVPALELRVMTHLARADERAVDDDARTGREFEAALAARGPHRSRSGWPTSIGNSAGTLGWPQGAW